MLWDSILVISYGTSAILGLIARDLSVQDMKTSVGRSQKLHRPTIYFGYHITFFLQVDY